MSVILYNILNPTVFNDTRQNERSHDTQVNGLGFYRTVANGTDGLLVDRVRAFQYLFAISSPSDVTALPSLFSLGGLNTIISQFVLPAYNYHFGYDFENSSYAFTTFADKGAILAGNDTSTPQPPLIEGIGYMTARVLDITTGTFAVHDWELSTTTSDYGEESLARATYNWEGVNNWTMTPETGGAGAVFVAVPRQGGVGFAFWDVLNNSSWRVETTEGQVFWSSWQHRMLLKPHIIDQTQLDDWLANGDATATDGSEEIVDVFITQRWETADTPAGLDPAHSSVDENLVSDQDGFVSDITGNINSEDASGRRATYAWEIDLFDIEETTYWVFNDATEDTDLGATIELDNDVPESNNIAAVFQEHMFLAGDPDNPHYLYWSKRFKPEAFPLENFVEIGTAADPIRSIQPQTGVLGVFTSNTKYRVQGNATAGFIHDEAVSHRGAPAPKSVVATDKGVFFVARDGVFVTNFLSADEKISDAIDPLFLGLTKNGYSPINFDALNEVAGGFYKNKYYFSYPSGTATQNDATAVFSVDSKTWTFWDVGFASFYAENDTDLFLAGGYDSLVYVIENPEAFDDNGTAISFELQTGDFTGSTQTTRNVFLYFKVDAECVDGELTAQFYVDDTLIQTHTIDGTRANQLLRLPENAVGFRWRMRLTYTGNRRIAVHGVTAVFLPLLAAA